MKLSPEHFTYMTPAAGLEVTPVARPELAAGSTRTAQQEQFVRHTISPFISLRVTSALSQFLEGLVVLLVGLLTAGIYPGLHSLSAQQLYVPLVLATAAGFPVVMKVAGGYNLRSLLNPLNTMTTMFAIWALLFACIMVGLMLTKSSDDVSRLWVITWLFAGGAALAATRYGLFKLVQRWNTKGQLSRLAVMIGGGAPAHKLQEALNTSTNSDVRIIGVFDDRGEDRLERQPGDLPRLGNVSQLVDFVRKARVDILLVTLPLGAEDRLLHVLNKLWVLPVDIRISAQSQKLRYRPRAYSYVGSVPFLDVFDKPLGEWGAVAKAIEDRIVAAIALILLAPVFALVALAIKLDSKGPVFFIQKRFGFNNELIEVFKFRSMYS